MSLCRVQLGRSDPAPVRSIIFALSPNRNLDVWSKITVRGKIARSSPEVPGALLFDNCIEDSFRAVAGIGVARLCDVVMPLSGGRTSGSRRADGGNCTGPARGGSESELVFGFAGKRMTFSFPWCGRSWWHVPCSCQWRAEATARRRGRRWYCRRIRMDRGWAMSTTTLRLDGRRHGRSRRFRAARGIRRCRR